MDEYTEARDWLVSHWIDKIVNHNREYDPASLLYKVTLAVDALTDDEVLDYVSRLKLTTED